MKLLSRDTSNDGKGKKYARATYRCAADDAWICVETPKVAKPKAKPRRP